MIENKMNLKVRVGDKISINPNLIPTDAIEPKPTVIKDNIFDPNFGIFHKVMFNAGTKGVVFKSVLDQEITAIN